jgi:hypothetical protein
MCWKCTRHRAWMNAVEGADSSCLPGLKYQHLVLAGSWASVRGHSAAFVVFVLVFLASIVLLNPRRIFPVRSQLYRVPHPEH